MKIINFFQLLGLSKSAGYSANLESEPDLHHHDLTDGSELLDETLHMREQLFEDNEEDDYLNE